MTADIICTSMFAPGWNMYNNYYFFVRRCIHKKCPGGTIFFFFTHTIDFYRKKNHISPYIFVYHECINTIVYIFIPLAMSIIIATLLYHILAPLYIYQYHGIYQHCRLHRYLDNSQYLRPLSKYRIKLTYKKVS